MPTLNHKATVVILLIITLSICGFHGVIGFEFVDYDDNGYVFENPHVLSGLSLEGVRWSFTALHEANWHPLTWLSHMLDVELFGLDPAGHHLVSLWLHIANSVLLFLALYSPTNRLLLSGIVAASFAIHPLHVESVAWVAERKDVLSTFFWLSAMLAYGTYAKRPTAVRYVLVSILFILGLMAKPMVVTLPFVLLLLDYWPLKRYAASDTGSLGPFLKRFGRLAFEKTPLLILSVLVSILAYIAQTTGDAIVSLDTLPVMDRFANAALAYGAYLAKTVWPRHLAFFYPHPESIRWDLVLLSVFLILFITWMSFRYWRRYPFFPVGWLWYLGTLLPVIGIVKAGFQGMADRYTYIPLIGVFVAAVWGVAALLKPTRYGRVIGGISVIPVLILLTTGTWLQTRHWENTFSLCTRAIDVTKDNYLAHLVIAKPLLRSGKLEEAVMHLNRSFRIKPSKNAAASLGVALSRMGNAPRAIAYYQTAVAMDPGYSLGHYNLGKLHFLQGNDRQSIAHFQNALRADPGMALAMYNLSWLRGTSPDADVRNGEEAVGYGAETARLTRYRQPLAFDALAAAYAESGDFSEAVSHAERGIDLATALDMSDLATEIKKRLQLYQEGKPFRQPVSLRIP